MGEGTPSITAAELRIMKVLWTRSPATVREVKDELAAQSGDEPAYTTVMTMMNQLAAKGALDVDKSRQPFFYQPAVQRDAVLGDRLKHFLQNVFDGQAGELVMRLVEESKLSPDELKRIESKIERRELDESKDKGSAPGARRKGRKGGAS